ncbi:MAG: isoprenylcysteine carboxylmethyltransferase family protein [Longimicrobiales bacterium]
MAHPLRSGIRIPPGLWFVPLLVLGYSLERRYPSAFLPSAMASVAGIALIACGFALLAWASWHFHRAGTAIDHHRPTSRLLTGGPFRWSRNPVYVALALVVAGLGVERNSLWIVLGVLPPLVLLHLHVVPREEAYLARLFGPEYERYRASVRRWF